MKALIQRVSQAKVTVENQVIGEIDKGILVFLGITHEDTEKEINYLLNKIVEFQPNFTPPSNLNTWTKDIDRAIRLDNRTEDQLVGCINWIYNNPKGSFWIPNIHSGKKLREKYNTMESQMMQSNSKNEQTMKNLKIAEDIYNAK